jgi:hypothetical protein
MTSQQAFIDRTTHALKTNFKPRLKALFTSLLALTSSPPHHRLRDWRDRAVYQVLTDRFAGGQGTCEGREYCGGTWAGLVERLGYIQGMGFDAVGFFSHLQYFCLC